MTSPLESPEAWDRVGDGYSDEFAPVLAAYAQAAVTLAALAPGARVLDVAAGPGTLTLLAAPVAGHVAALDFSAVMIARLRGEAGARGLHNVEAVVGDGQALPFPDASFDAAFSMFGLIFFPDRARGLRELRRVLRPGGRAVVGAWATLDPAAPFVLFEVLQAELPDVRLMLPELPLGTPDRMREELAAAGFEALRVAFVVHEFRAPSVEALWASHARANVLVAPIRQGMPRHAWERLSARVIGGLRERLGDGEVRYPQTALLGLGERGADARADSCHP